MKRLTLVRHARAASSHHTLADADRPLAPRGREDAIALGRYLLAHGWVPDRILMSPALRARDTALLLAQTMAVPESALDIDERIYEATTGELMDVLEALPDQNDDVMVVGHNPAMERVCATLSHGRVSHLAPGDTAHLHIETDTWVGIHRAPVSVCEHVQAHTLTLTTTH